MKKEIAKLPNDTMVYKFPGSFECHGGMFDYKVVDANTDALQEALDEGWYLTTPEAKQAYLDAKAEQLKATAVATPAALSSWAAPVDALKKTKA